MFEYYALYQKIIGRFRKNVYSNDKTIDFAVYIRKV